MGSLAELMISPFHIYEGERQFVFWFWFWFFFFFLIEIEIHVVSILFIFITALSSVGQVAWIFLFKYLLSISTRVSIAPHVSIDKGNSSNCTFWQWFQPSNTQFLCGKQSVKNAASTACTMFISTMPQAVSRICSTLRNFWFIWTYSHF